MKKALFVATVVKTHIMTFHIPYLKMLKEMGYETAVAARNDYENPEDCVIPYCDNYYDIPFERSPLKTANLKAYKALKRIIDEGDYDIIHCHTPVGAMLTRLAALRARKRGTKVIYTAHGFHFYKGAPLINWLLYFPVEWFLARFTDALITINKEDYSRAQKLAAKKVYYVPGVGIDTSRFTPNPEAGELLRSELGIRKDEFVMLSVGEVNANKNHQVVVRALPHLKQCKYVICGVGPLGEELKSLATELGVGKQLLLAGYRSDISRFYQMADCFVFPSLREGLSVALMEAMGAETPIACTAIRGNTDLIEDRVTGYIVKNDPADVARTLQRIIEHKNERHNCAVAAREKLRQFDLRRVVENVRKIYLTILEK